MSRDECVGKTRVRPTSIEPSSAGDVSQKKRGLLHELIVTGREPAGTRAEGGQNIWLRSKTGGERPTYEDHGLAP